MLSNCDKLLIKSKKKEGKRLFLAWRGAVAVFRNFAFELGLGLEWRYIQDLGLRVTAVETHGLKGKVLIGMVVFIPLSFKSDLIFYWGKYYF